MTTYTIKPLEWSAMINQELLESYNAEAEFTDYYVIRTRKQWYYTINSQQPRKCKSLEEGKAKCEAHWRSVMEKCLTKVNE